MHRVVSVLWLLSAGLIAVSNFPCLAVEVDLHVAAGGSDEAAGDAAAPLATPRAAIDRLPELSRQSPDAVVRVLLRAGTYRIDRPLLIERKHVPSRGSLTFVADGGLAVLSGGRAITGWRVGDDGSWSVTIPDAANGKWKFRELFVNGQRRWRARHPNAGYLRIDKAFDDKRSGFTFAEGDLSKDWTDGGELVFLHDWSTSRIPVRQVEHDSRRLTVAFPIGNRADHYNIDHFEPHPRYYLEDHAAFLDVPGEWLLGDDGVLTYHPLSDEKPESTEVVAPRAEALLIVNGDDEGPVRNVHFQGIHFELCAWQLPEQGFAASQATAYEQRGQEQSGGGRNFVPAAIQFENAENCSITHSRISRLGTSGVQFGSRTRNCRLEDCVLEDISGNGVNLGEDSRRTVNGRPWWQAAPEQAAAGNIVRHNRIERCGQQFYGAVAVWVGLARETQITHNEIAHHPYTGVSLGWMWNPTPTPAGENLVANNHIHHVMQVLSDGGGIYTLGRQKGTKLTGNVIHDVPLNAGRAESNGMFLDEGSDQMEITGNTIWHIDRSPLRFHRAQQMTVRENVLVVPTAATPPIRYNNTDPRTVKQVENRFVSQAQFDTATIAWPTVGPRK